MGNRAIITGQGQSTGIYLHWNGGEDSVKAFLRYAQLKGLPQLEQSETAILPLAVVVTNFFGNDGMTIALETGITNPRHVGETWDLDNGLYVVAGWQIVNHYGYNPHQHAYAMGDMLAEIDQAQPSGDQLGAEVLNAVPVPVSQLAIGDRIYIPGQRETATITTRTNNGWVTNQWPGEASNPNNLIRDETVQLVERPNEAAESAAQVEVS